MQPPLQHNIWDTVTNPGLLVSAGANTGSLSAVTFSNSNGVSFGLNAGVITASMSGGTGAAGSLTVSDSATSLAVSQLAFTNSNGLTLTLSTAPGAATLIGSYTVPTVTNSSWTVSDSATSATVGQLAFTATNGITLALSTSNNGKHTVFGSYTVPTVTNSSWTVSDSATSATVGRLAFVNGNGVTFALSTSNNGQQSVSGSVFTNYAGTGFTSATTAGTAIVGTLNNNGLSVGVPAFITTSPAVTNSSWTVSDSATSVTVGRLMFSNANNVSFGLITSNNGSQSVTASIATTYAGTGVTTATTTGTNIVATLNTSGLSMGVPAVLTTAALSSETLAFSLGGNSGTTNSSQISNGGYVLAGGANVTILQSNNTISISAASAAASPVQFSAGTTSQNLGTIKFADSNRISFGLGTGANSSVMTAKAVVAFSAGTLVSDLNALQFLDSNGVSFGLSGFNLTATVKTDYAGTNTSVATTAGTDLSFAVNTSGVTIAYPKWITTAGAGGGVAISNSQTLFSSGTVALSEGGGAITIASSAGGQSLMFSVPQTSSLVGTSGVSISTSGSTISIYHSCINGVGVSNTGNTAGNVGYLTNSNYALAGSGSITLSQSTAAGAATCWIQHPAWITTATQSSWTVSDSATSATVGRLAFVNGNGVSFALSTSNNGLQSVSASIATTYAGTGFTSATTAGVAIVATLNTSGLSMGVPAMLTTAALSSAHMSYFENMPILDAASTTLSAGISALQVVPFVVPRNISIGFLRVPISMSYVSTEVSGTTVNTTWTYNRSYTDAAAIFTQLGGASSLSLGYLTSSSCTWVFQNVGGAGAQGSRYTITQNVTYPLSGTTSNYTTSYAQSSANIQISSASMTLFTGPRWLDIPLGVSLSGGNYWLALGRSTNSATTGGNNSAINGASAGMSYIGVSQNNQTICFPGAVTASSCQLQPGLGSWSTNSAVLSTSSLQLASISAMSSGAKPYFQMIRYA